MDKYVTIINIGLTSISVICAIFSLKTYTKQTTILEEQLKEIKKPDFPLTLRLDSIINQLATLNETLKKFK